MRKGQRIRVLQTNELGTIADKMLIRKNGSVKTYCKIHLDKNPKQDTWLFSEQLGSTKECATVTLADERGRKLALNVTKFYDKLPDEHNMKLELKCVGDGCLRDHVGGLHFFLAAFLLKALSEERE